MLGDTAVAVNPKDKRYLDIIGKELILPLTGRKIPVIADDYVEMDFGTGALKITPAHDPNDFEIGLRHNLEVIKVIEDNGVMSENTERSIKGLTDIPQEERIVEELKKRSYRKNTRL